jgi:dihydroorotate dehydrogenase (NAD+) catalytic subunit
VSSPAVTALGTTFRNPVLLASGTAGFGREVARVVDLGAIGGLVTKAVSVEPRAGNPAPRVAEVRGAMLNAVGLANPGLAAARDQHLPWLRAHLVPGTRVLVNVVGHQVEEFAAVVAGLRDEPVITAFELNVSCPNVQRGGLEFGADPAVLGELVRRARAETDRPLVVKLSPALADHARTATAAAEAGADGFTCVNTLPALVWDERPPHPARLGNTTGGLSGPPLLPIGVRVTRVVAGATGRPVIGVGGVRTGRDAWQYLRAGAVLVGVGTAAMADPHSPARIARELTAILAAEGVPADG